MLLKGLGNETLLFTTDNGRTQALKCGKIPEVYATVDFGPGKVEFTHLMNFSYFRRLSLFVM